MVLGIQARCPARVQATCRFTPVVWCLPQSQPRGAGAMTSRAPRVPSMMYWRIWVEVLHLRYPRLEEFGDQRGVGRDQS